MLPVPMLTNVETDVPNVNIEVDVASSNVIPMKRLRNYYSYTREENHDSSMFTYPPHAGDVCKIICLIIIHTLVRKIMTLNVYLSTACRRCL